mmetsp:Transcript_36718/g.84132  ORF Transcript_36718/g.84132 Transcript_36718/m.84132 type:complete len:136 (-) Transcript_36718:387-794(-)
MSAPLSDTTDSHRLVLWAERQQRAKGEALALAVGRRYFEQARALADHAVLLEAAAEVGLDRAAALAYLQSDEGREEVWQAAVDAQRQGIHSIPVFMFSAGEFSETVHGSADVERFSQVFQAIKRHWKAREASSCS